MCWEHEGQNFHRDGVFGARHENADGNYEAEFHHWRGQNAHETAHGRRTPPTRQLDFTQRFKDVQSSLKSQRYF